MSFECYIILRGFEEAYSNDSHDLPTIYQKNMLKTPQMAKAKNRKIKCLE